MICKVWLRTQTETHTLTHTYTQRERESQQQQNDYNQCTTFNNNFKYFLQSKYFNKYFTVEKNMEYLKEIKNKIHVSVVY